MAGDERDDKVAEKLAPDCREGGACFAAAETSEVADL